MTSLNGNQHHQINIVSASHSQPAQLPLLYLPRRDLLDGREDFNAICVPLFEAITTNDFEAAKLILGNRPELVQFSITENCETILHVAVLGKSYLLVQYLTSLMTKKDLELPNGNGETALSLVARTKNIEIATALVEKNDGLVNIPNGQGMMPLQVAALYGRPGMVEYLYNSSQKMIGQVWTQQNRSWVFEKCVEHNLFGVALQMVIDLPELAINGSVLRLLARNRHTFLPRHHTFVRSVKNLILSAISKHEDEEKKALRLLRIMLKDIMKLPKAEIDDLIRGPADEDAKQKYSSHVLFLAAQMGNTLFVAEVIQKYPHLALEVNDDNHSIFHVAVLHRHLGIFKLLFEKDYVRDLIITLEDKNGNNILHLVGEYVKDNRKPYISGLGIRTDRELRWFERVESILPDYLCKKRNTAGLTPYELFIKNHRDLFSIEEKLMKEAGNQLMVVAAVVATISFATIFTFPGGYIQDTSISILLQKPLSTIFIICDSLSFLFSSTSILMVLSILLYGSDPRAYFTNSSSSKIVASMIFVFYSIITIITTYLIGLFIIFQSRSQWIPISIATSAFVSYRMFVFINRRCLIPLKSLLF